LYNKCVLINLLSISSALHRLWSSCRVTCRGWLAACQPGTCHVGRLVRRPRQMLKEGVERRSTPRYP